MGLEAGSRMIRDAARLQWCGCPSDTRPGSVVDPARIPALHSVRAQERTAGAFGAGQGKAPEALVDRVRSEQADVLIRGFPQRLLLHLEAPTEGVLRDEARLSAGVCCRGRDCVGSSVVFFGMKRPVPPLNSGPT